MRQWIDRRITVVTTYAWSQFDRRTDAAGPRVRRTRYLVGSPRSWRCPTCSGASPEVKDPSAGGGNSTGPVGSWKPRDHKHSSSSETRAGNARPQTPSEHRNANFHASVVRGPALVEWKVEIKSTSATMTWDMSPWISRGEFLSINQLTVSSK